MNFAIDSAESRCGETDWLDSYLWLAMGVTYPPYPSNLEEFDALRDELSNIRRTRWAQLGAHERRRLYYVGVIYRLSKYGMSFDAIGQPSVGGAGPILWMFRICKERPCAYLGGAKRSKKRVYRRIMWAQSRSTTWRRLRSRQE